MGAKLSPRSEEHTSELQSHHDLVCRLLLEKKNEHVHVTVLQIEQSQVVEHGPTEKDTYVALQVGVGKAKVKNVSAAERCLFTDAETAHIYNLSLHDALPI